MSTGKNQRKSRFPTAVRPVAQPFPKGWDSEDKLNPAITFTFNLTEASKMITVEANEALPPGLERNSILSGEQSMPLGFSTLLGPLELAKQAHEHEDSNYSDCEGRQIREDHKQVAPSYLLLGDTGSATDPPTPNQIGSQSAEDEHGSRLEPKRKEVTADRGKAPMRITTQMEELTPPSPNDCCKNIPEYESEAHTHKTDDPSKAPAGSLIHTLYLHTLYLQLLEADIKGMTVKELLASFKKDTAWQGFEMDWEHEVRFHMQNNPHFYYKQPGLRRQVESSSIVTCMDPMTPDTASDLELSMGRSPQWDIQDPAPMPRAMRQITAGDLELSLRRTLSWDIKDPTPSPIALKWDDLELSLGTTLNGKVNDPKPPPRATRQLFWMDHHKGVPTRRTACQEEKKAFLTQSAMELEKIHIQQSEVPKQMTPWVAGPSSSQLTTQRMPLPKWSMKRKRSSGGNKKLGETMTGVQCNRRDVPEKWNCPLNAMEGRKFCEHHYSKDAAKRARYAGYELVGSLYSKGGPGLPAFQMHSIEEPWAAAEQLVESNLISLVGAMSRMESEVDRNLCQPAQGHPNNHCKGNVNCKIQHVNYGIQHPRETGVARGDHSKQEASPCREMTPASTVAEKMESDGRLKVAPLVRPSTVPSSVTIPGRSKESSED